MTSTRLPSYALGGLATLALAGACNTSDFPEVTRLDRLRILAVRAEPVNPAEDTSTVLEPLVYTNSGQASTFAWSWCPILGFSADGFECPLAQADLDALATQLGLDEPPPPLELGTDPTQSWKNVFPAATLATICAQGVNGFDLDCDGGFPVRFKVTISNDGTSVIATTVVRLPIDAAPSNVNPSIAGIQAILDGQPVAIDESAAATIPRLEETELRAVVDPAQSESYPALTVDGKPTTLKERLIVSWFSEQGDISTPITAFIDGKTDLADALENTIQPLTTEDDPADQARLILVLRDNRGGVSWTTGVAKLGAQP